VVVDLEAEPLVSAAVEHHERATVFAHVKDLAPKTISDSGAYAAAEDTRADLKEPPRQMSSKACGAGSQDEHYHGGSSSPKF
jgi:hypothetical protein